MKPMRPMKGWRGAGAVCCLGVAGASAPPCDVPVPLPVGPGAFALVSADFNADGLLDIASVLPDGVSVALNRGEHGFDEPRVTRIRPLVGGGYYPVPAYLASADIDGDGRLDLVQASQTERCGVDVLLGNGDGTFRSSGRFNVIHPGEVDPVDGAYVCMGLITSDLNHDGRDDVVVSHERFTFDSLFGYDVFLSDASGFLDPPALTPLDGMGPMVSGDMNGDGELDLVVASSRCERGCWSMDAALRIEVHLGDGEGKFLSPILAHLPAAPETYVLGVAVGQFDAGSALDVAVLDTGGCCIDDDGTSLGPQRWLLLGNGDGSLQLHDVRAAVSDSSFLRRNRLSSADVDGDGRDDLVADSGSDLWLERGKGHGRFRSPRVLASGYVPPTRVLLGEDVDGDGRNDLVTVAADTGVPWVVPLD
jgi:VCBS repeat protein